MHVSDTDFLSTTHFQLRMDNNILAVNPLMANANRVGGK